ncbi:hypothetical protein FI667_g134, partial [Globisporangium splendens]
MHPYITQHLKEMHTVPLARRRDAEAVLALQHHELLCAHAHEQAHIRSIRAVKELAPAAVHGLTQQQLKNGHRDARGGCFISAFHGGACRDEQQSELEALQNEYVDKQVKQNLLDKIIQIETTEELQAAIAAPTQAHAAYQRNEQELEAALQERKRWLQHIEATVREIEREKHNVIEQDFARPAFENELERLANEWKELQKQNAQRRATIQMATSVMINDEDDCSRVLDQQTQSIQELMEKQKQLEDKKLDINAQVQQTQKKIASLTKKNDLRNKDIEAKQREEDFLTLQRMKQWYEDMKRISAQISGLEISHISNEFMEVNVLKTHSMRFFYDSDSLRVRHVELLQPDIVAEDLVTTVLRDNDLRFFLCEYRDRVRNATLSAYAATSMRA